MSRHPQYMQMATMLDLGARFSVVWCDGLGPEEGSALAGAAIAANTTEAFELLHQGPFHVVNIRGPTCGCCHEC